MNINRSGVLLSKAASQSTRFLGQIRAAMQGGHEQSRMPNGFWILCAVCEFWRVGQMDGCEWHGTYAMDVEAGRSGTPGGSLSITSARRNGRSSEAPCAADSGPAATGALKYGSSNMEAPAAALAAPAIRLLLLRPLRAGTPAVIACHAAASKCHGPVILDLLHRSCIFTEYMWIIHTRKTNINLYAYAEQ